MEARQHSDMSESKTVLDKDFSSPCFVLGWRGDEDELVNIDSSDDSRDEGEAGKIVFSEQAFTGIAASNEVNSVSLCKTRLANDGLCGVDEVPSEKISAVQDSELLEFSGSQEDAMHGTVLLNGRSRRKIPEEGFIAHGLNVLAGSNNENETETNSSPVSQELSSQKRLQVVEKLEKRTHGEESIDLKDAGDSEGVVPAKRLKAAAQLTLHEKGVTKLGMTSERLDARKFRKAFTDKLLGMKSLKRMSIVAQAKPKIGQDLLVLERGKAREQSVDTSGPVNAVSGSLVKNSPGNKPVEGCGLEELLNKKFQTCLNTREGVDLFRNKSRLLDSAVKAQANDIDGNPKNAYARGKRLRNSEPLKVVHRGENIERSADRQRATQPPRKKIKVQEIGIRSMSLNGDQERSQNSNSRKSSGNKGPKSHGITKQNVTSREKTGLPFDNFVTVRHKKGKAVISKKAPEGCSNKDDQQLSTSRVFRDSGCKHSENAAVRRILGKFAFEKQKKRGKQSLSTIKGSSDSLIVEKRAHPSSRRDRCYKKRNANTWSKSSWQLQEIVPPSERRELGKSLNKDRKPSFRRNMQAEQGEEMDNQELDHVDESFRSSSRSSNELLVASRPTRKRRKLEHATLSSILTGKEVDQSNDIQLAIGNKVTNTGQRDSSVKHNVAATSSHEKVIDASNSGTENEKWKSSQWVECILCKKWRRIPFDVEITTKKWQCKDNIWEDTMAELAHQCDSDSTSVSATRSLSVNLPNLAEVVVLGNEALDGGKQVGEGCIIGRAEQKELVWVKIEDNKLWWPARHVHAVEWPENLEKRRLLANENVVCLFKSEGSSQEYMIKKTSSLLPFGEHYDTLKDSNSTTLFKAAVTKAYEIYLKDCEILEESSAQAIKEARERKDDAEELANFDDRNFTSVASYDTDVIHHPQGLITSESFSVAAVDYSDEVLPSQFLSDAFTTRNQGDPELQVVNDNTAEHREAVQEGQNCKAVTEFTRLDLGSANVGINFHEKGTTPFEQMSGSEAACGHHHHGYSLSSPLTSVIPESGCCSSCIKDHKSDPEAVALDHVLQGEKDFSTGNVELQCTSSENAAIQALDQMASYAGKLSENDRESRSKIMYDVASQEPVTLRGRKLVRQAMEVFDRDSNQQPTIEVKGKLKDQDVGSEVDADEDPISDYQLKERDITIWSSNDAHHSFCEVCGEGGELLCCDGKTCRNTYHLGCLDPPLNEVPKGNWYCPDCSSEVHAVFGEVESIWDAQKGTLAAHPGIFADGMDGGPLEDIYYVKWKQRAHIHNHWVSGSELLKLAPKKLKIFKKKIQQGKALKWDPEWAVPHRVIGKRQSVGEIEKATRSILECGNEWYVKWKNLGYDQCTWESTKPVLCSIPTMADLERNYELRCAAARYRAALERMHEAKKLREETFSKLTQQPDWVVGGQLLPRQIDVLNQLRKFWKNYTNGIVIDGASQERIVTTINFVVSLIEEFRVVRPILVVGPSDTIPVWEAEIAQWAPTINAVTYSGGREAREVIRKFEIGTSVEPIKVQLLLTSFEILNADVNHLREVKWEAFLIDEGQRIRAAKTFQNLKLIEAEFCVFASSEKLKLNLEDLIQVYTLVERDSSLLRVESCKSFLHEDEDVQLEDLQKKLNLYTVCDYQCETPPDIHVEYWVPVTMPEVQVHEYCKILVQNYELLQSSRMRPDNKGSFRDLLLKLRECCNHPNTVTFSIQASLAKVIPGRALLDAGIKASGKLQLLHLMLLQLKLEGRRVLILTQTTCLRGVVSKIDILEDYLRQQFGVDAYERLDGGLAWPKKQAALQRFNARDSDRFVFLTDRRSCGFSLKLFSVDTIIIYDSDWNPHTDIQALLRAHISSKSRKLQVYRLYSRNTLEERVLLGAYQTGASDQKQKTFTSKFFQKAVRWGAETLLKLDEQNFATNSPSSNLEPRISNTTSPFIVRNALEGAQDELVFDTETVTLILSGTPQPSSRSSINYFLRKVLSPREMGADVTEKGLLLYGVTQETLNEEEGESEQEFWNRILKEKFEQWQAKEEERNPRKGQRVRKKVQYDESIDKSVGEILVAPSDVLEERRLAPSDVGLERKVLLKALNALSEEMSHSKSIAAGAEMSRMPFITESHTKSTTLGLNPQLAGEVMAVEPHPPESSAGEFEASKSILQSKPEKEQCSSEECSECAKSVHSVQKQLHVAMKPELANLCQSLRFPRVVADHAGELLAFVVHNFRLPKEPRSLVHAVELSLCWVAAERLGLNLNFVRTLNLAREHLDFKLKDQQLKLTYEKLKDQCMRYKLPSTSLAGKPTTEPGGDSPVEAYPSPSGLQEPNPPSRTPEPRDCSMHPEPEQTTSNLSHAIKSGSFMQELSSQSQTNDGHPPLHTELRFLQPQLQTPTFSSEALEQVVSRNALLVPHFSTGNENVPISLAEMLVSQTSECTLVDSVVPQPEKSAAVPPDGCLSTDSIHVMQQGTHRQQLDLVSGSLQQPEQVSPEMLASLKVQLSAKKVGRMRNLLNHQKSEFCDFDSYMKKERESLRSQHISEHVLATIGNTDMKDMLIHQKNMHAIETKSLEERLQKERRELVSKQTTDREKENRYFAMQMESLNAGKISLIDPNLLKDTCFVKSAMPFSALQEVLPQLNKSTGPLIPGEGEPPETENLQVDSSTEVEMTQCTQQNVLSQPHKSPSPSQQEQGVRCSLQPQCDTDIATRFITSSSSVCLRTAPDSPLHCEGQAVGSSSVVQQESDGQLQRIPEPFQQTQVLRQLPEASMQPGASVAHEVSSQHSFQVDLHPLDVRYEFHSQNPNLRPPQTSSTSRQPEHLQHQRRQYSSSPQSTQNFLVRGRHVIQGSTIQSSVHGGTPAVTPGYATLIRDEAHVSSSALPLQSASLPSLRAAQLHFQDPLRNEEMKLRREQEKLKQTFSEESTRIKTQYEKEAAALKKKYESLLLEEHKSFTHKSETLQKNILKVELNRRLADALRMKDLIFYSAQSLPGLNVENATGGARVHPLAGGTYRGPSQHRLTPISTPAMHRVSGSHFNYPVVNVPGLDATSRVPVNENFVTTGMSPFPPNPIAPYTGDIGSFQPTIRGTSLPTSHTIPEALPVITNMSTFTVDATVQIMHSNLPPANSQTRQCSIPATIHGGGSFSNNTWGLSPTIQQSAHPSISAALTQSSLVNVPVHHTVNMENEVPCLPLRQTIPAQTTITGIENDIGSPTILPFVPGNLSATVHATSIPNTSETASLTNLDGVIVGGMRIASEADGSSEVQSQVEGRQLDKAISYASQQLAERVDSHLQGLATSEIPDDGGCEIILEQQGVIYLSDDD